MANWNMIFGIYRVLIMGTPFQSCWLHLTTDRDSFLLPRCVASRFGDHWLRFRVDHGRVGDIVHK